MIQIYHLDQISPLERSLVGEKAFALSQLLQHGYPVLPGFVISTSTLEEFLIDLGNSEPLLVDWPQSSLHLDIHDYLALQGVARRIRQQIFNAPLPENWLTQLWSAVNSLGSSHLIWRASLSLSQQFIGGRGELQQENPSGLISSTWTSLSTSRVSQAQFSALETALKYAWGELFRARSLFYWYQMGIDLGQVKLAILIQPYQDVISAGILEAKNNSWLIRANWGLAQSISWGEVEADYYQVNRLSREIEVRDLGQKAIAYRLKDSSLPTACTELALREVEGGSGSANFLEIYATQEQQREQFVLDESFLGEVSSLAQEIWDEYGKFSLLEWQIIPGEGNLPQLYIHKVLWNSRNEPQVPSRSPESNSSSASTSRFDFPEYESIQGQFSTSSQEALLEGLSASPGRVIASAHLVRGTNLHLQAIPPGRILVTKAIAPDWLPLLKKAAGVITEQGGTTSHGAIIAREFGIPAVVGAKGATEVIKQGESLLLEGSLGRVYRVTNSQLEKKLLPTPREPLHRNRVIEKESFSPATQLLVNLSQVSSIAQATTLPVEGVGLLRSELMLLELLAEYPLDWWLSADNQTALVGQLRRLIGQFSEGFAPRPVFYRSTDWRGTEFARVRRHRSHKQLEIKSILGQRGTFSYLSDSSLFELELEALAQLCGAGHSNLRLILPFVRSVEEFTFARQLVSQAGLLGQAGFKLWIMAEVPSVIFLLPEYVKAGVQGISLGTNDLTQLLLGVDRDEVDLAGFYDERHPAVLAALKQLITTANEEGIPCSICGQAPARYPELIDSLVRWGITAISVEAQAVNTTYAAIKRAERRLLLEAARKRIE